MKYWLAMILNACIALVTLIIMLYYFQPKNGVSGWKRGTGTFIYFTIQSNVFSAIVSFAYLILNLTGIIIPKWFMVLRFVATVSVALTCLTVIFYLGPLYGYKSQLTDENIHMHLVGPVMAFISTCFLESDMRLSLWQMLLGLIPPVLYGALYIYKVIVRKQWKDFYGFVKADIRKSGSLMLLLTAVICLLTGLVYNRF